MALLTFIRQVVKYEGSAYFCPRSLRVRIIDLVQVGDISANTSGGVRIRSDMISIDLIGGF